MDLRQRLRTDLWPDGRRRNGRISRTSIWQWIHHQKTLNDGTPVTKALFRQWLAEELMVIQEELGEHRFSHGRFDDAARLMEQITTSDELIDFLTLPGYRLLA